MSTKPRRRKRPTEREVLLTLILQGAVIHCFRSGERITRDNVKRVQREHLHEFELDGPDVPENWRYSLDEPHSVVTNGTKATSAGSSKHRIAKANNPNRTEKFRVNKRAPGEPKPRSRWPSRPMKSRNTFRPRAAQ